MEWYYAIEGQRRGPVSNEDFARLVAEATVSDETLVWRAGMANWQPWREVAPGVQLPPVSPLPPAVPVEPPKGWPAAAPAAPAMHYGGFWLRLVAKLIDGIILFVVGNIVSTIALGDTAQSLQGLDPQDPAAVGLVMAAMGKLLLIGFVIGLSYHWFFLAKFAATPGKLALGLRIVRGDGAQLSQGRIVARFFAEYLSAFILYIGYVIAAFDDQKRTLHDTICDTRVIRKS